MTGCCAAVWPRLFAVAALCWLTGVAYGEVYRLTSPVGDVHAEIAVSDGGQLYYKVGNSALDVVSFAALGITVDKKDLGKVKRLSILRLRDEHGSYPVRGVHAMAKMDATRALYYLETDSGVNYGLQAMVASEGFAWRILVPGEGERRVEAETAGWRWPDGSRVWYASGQPAAGAWTNAVVNDLAGMDPAWQARLPLVVELPRSQGYAAMMEVMPCGAYGALRMRAGDEGLISGHLLAPEGIKTYGAIEMPWRVIMLARTLDGLVNNDLLNHLAPPPDPALFENDDWVRGGRSVRIPTGPETSGRESFTYAAAVDQAATLGFEYATLAADWDKADDAWEILKELCVYGKAKGVGIFVTRQAMELGAPENGYAALQGFLDKLQAAGAVGVKMDFPGQSTAKEEGLAGRVLHEAALRRLLVNLNLDLHPAGSPRTYPNELTRGRIPFDLPASGNAALLFTRCLAGHAGYGTFNFSSNGETTWTHRLAMGVLVTSPLMLLDCEPRLLLDESRLAAAARLIKALPTEWDETRVLEGSRIGELAVMARRKGDVWHVAMVNGTPRMQIATFSPSFTGWQSLKAACFKDVPGRLAEMDFAEQELSGSETMILTLEPHGGFVARLERAAVKSVGD
ncbi:MAG: glycoside hydrolase family 97 N-terminal domain-containing protein [Kiritimatiellae bacterium]|nr:glycoside hydrolase family 97 N-terminal domain-containing protein [Kiritimatiellia bacterium]